MVNVLNLMNKTIINTPTYIRPGIWSKKVKGNLLMVQYFAKFTLSGGSKYKTNSSSDIKIIENSFLLLFFLQCVPNKLKSLKVSK